MYVQCRCMSLCIRMHVCTHVLKCIRISYIGGERVYTQEQQLHYFCLLSLYHIPCLVCVQFESAWTQQTPVSLKYQNLGGGRKPAFERPSKKKRKVE